ncbi:glycosyltransferase family 4 protein [Microbacterium awajiense]
MRVLFSFPHAIGASGIGWSAWNQVDGLVRRGHEVHVVAASLARPVPGARVTTTLAAGRVRIPHRAIGRDRAFRVHDLAARALLRRGDYDLVHLWPLGTGATAREASTRGIPALREAPNTHTAHAWRVVGAEVDRLGLGEITTAHTADPVHLAMEEAEWEAATGILVPSDAVAESFAAAGFDRRRLLRHRYGYRPGTRRMHPRAVADPGGLRAVYVGLGEPRKGLHHALDAWLGSEASLTGTFTVVGRLLEPYRAHLADRLDHPSVRVVGFSSAVDAVLAAADVLVLPTIEEGSALVTYEAQGAGCVPLVSAAAGAVLDHGVEGYVHDPGDVAVLRDQLDLLAGDRGQLARMSEACLRHAPSLTWDAAAAALEDCYERAVVLAAGGSAPHDVFDPEETDRAVAV